MADSKEKLFSDFSPVSTEQWMDKTKMDTGLLQCKLSKCGREEARLEDKRRI